MLLFLCLQRLTKAFSLLLFQAYFSILITTNESHEAPSQVSKALKQYSSWLCRREKVKNYEKNEYVATKQFFCLIWTINSTSMCFMSLDFDRQWPHIILIFAIGEILTYNGLYLKLNTFFVYYIDASLISVSIFLSTLSIRKWFHHILVYLYSQLFSVNLRYFLFEPLLMSCSLCYILYLCIDSSRSELLLTFVLQ